jgi:hypothetical protein
MRLRSLLPAVVLLLVPVLSSPPAARAADPAFAVGSPAFDRAVAIGQAHWGVVPCGGDVSYSWGPLPAGTNAEATWSNDAEPYVNARANRRCHIVFNSTGWFDWPLFCTVVAHEIGHLVGHRHDPEPNRLMSAVYAGPIAECAAPAPAQAAAPASQSAPVATTAAARRAPQQRRRRVRVGCVVVRRRGRKVRRCVRLRHRRERATAVRRTR